MKRVAICSLFILHFLWVCVDCVVIILEWLLEKPYNAIHRLSYWTWHINDYLAGCMDMLTRRYKEK